MPQDVIDRIHKMTWQRQQGHCEEANEDESMLADSESGNDNPGKDVERDGDPYEVGHDYPLLNN
jgi:hypothetical protein